MPTLDEQRPWLEKFLVSLAALAFGLRFGLNYGISNHTTYLLHGLRLSQTQLFSRDWLVTQTTDFHHFFSRLAEILYELDTSGWIFAWANVLAVFVGAWLIYALVRQLTSVESRLPVYGLVLATLMATGTDGPGNTYLFSGIFQPSTLAVLGMLGALLFYIREEYWLSGLSLALGGFFHENYLILGSTIFFCAHLLNPGPGRVLRGLRQLFFPAIVLAIYLPSLMQQSFAPQAPAGMLLYTLFRAPHHHVPTHFYKQYFPLLGWLCLAASLGWEWYQEKAWAHLRAWVLAQVSIILVATALTTIVFIPAVSLFFAWRLAPLLELLLMLTVFTNLAEGLLSNREFQLNVYRLLLFAAGVCLVGFSFGRHQPWFPLFWLLLAMLLVWQSRGKGFVSWNVKTRQAWLRAGALAVWVVFSCVPVFQGLRQSSLLAGLPAGESALYAWARSTPVDALWLTPPELDGFRFWSQRAIVVDWKNTPSPREMPEWHRRLRDEAGGDFQDLSDLRNKYNMQEAGPLRAAAAKYGCDYVVVYRGTLAERQWGLPAAYANQEFVVLPVR